MSENERTQSIDVTAATLEEAIEQGLEQLGLPRNDVIIEVVQEDNRGLLGLGGRDAIVRLTPLRSPNPKPSSGTMYADADDDLDLTIGQGALETLLGSMGVEADVDVYRAAEVDDEERPWVLDIKGSDLGILIGRKGDTLEALQYITRLIVSRETQKRANIVLDVEGYKSRRESMLRTLAERMAEQAHKLGRTVTLEPMTPNERRIVHITLRNDENVTTESIGEGDKRKVTIIPVED